MSLYLLSKYLFFIQAHLAIITTFQKTIIIINNPGCHQFSCFKQVPNHFLLQLINYLSHLSLLIELLFYCLYLMNHQCKLPIDFKLILIQFNLLYIDLKFLNFHYSVKLANLSFPIILKLNFSIFLSIPFRL